MRLAARLLGSIVGILLLGLICGEGAVRWLGIDQFPLYSENPNFGYIPSPNQRGSFRNTNRWEYNEFSMGVGSSFQKNGKRDIILIGDSVVNGGNPTDQSNRLGPILERDTDSNVWPVSAGSWSLINELAWLEVHSRIAEHVDDIVFVLNSADFGRPSVWQSDTSTPSTDHISKLWSVTSRYFDLNSERPLPSDLVDPARDWTAEWVQRFNALSDRTSARLTVVLYPTRPEMLEAPISGKICGRSCGPLGSIKGLRIVDIGTNTKWNNPNFYRDDIHPNPDGNRVLAEIIAQELGR